MSSLSKIKLYYTKFSTAEKKVADYFFQNIVQAVGISIDELAKRVDVSKSTIVRFARTMGYSGYREFIITYSATGSEEMEKASQDDLPNYLDVKIGDTTEHIMKHVFAVGRQSIMQTMGVCEEKNVQLAVDAIATASRVDFFGVGAGALIALDAQHKFIRIGKMSIAFADYHAQVTAASTLRKGDVFVAISYSGETADTLHITQIAKANGACVISITKYGDNSISRLSDINIHVSSPESEVRSAATGSRMAQLCIIDILYTSVLSLAYDEVKMYLDASRKAILRRDNDIT